MMKALLSRQPGGSETLELADLPIPDPGPGELRVRVLACSINYPDVLMITDRYQFKPARPFAPGGEISGEVDAVGEGVADWTKGDRLIANILHGGLAEFATFAAGNAIRLPAGADPIESAALLLTYGTSLHALADRAVLVPGETVLILGAGGGIGLSAIEISKVMGARVIAAVSHPDKAAAASAAGADETLVYGAGPFDKKSSKVLAAAFKAAVGPAGAQVIYDPVGGDYAEPALRCIGWEGRYLVVGFPAGIPKMPLNLALLKACDIRGVFWGAFVEREPDRHRQHMARILNWWKEGKISPRVERVYPLQQGGDAINQLASRSAIGKVIVKCA